MRVDVKDRYRNDRGGLLDDWDRPACVENRVDSISVRAGRGVGVRGSPHTDDFRAGAVFLAFAGTYCGVFRADDARPGTTGRDPGAGLCRPGGGDCADVVFGGCRFGGGVGCRFAGGRGLAAWQGSLVGKILVAPSTGWPPPPRSVR